jgi:hypothetical protein
MKIKQVCSGCGKLKDLKARGMCGACYIAWRRYGDPLVRKRKVKGAELCSKCGRDPVHAKGLCKHCYSQEKLKLIGHDICKNCGELKKIVARGLCPKCYRDDLYAKRSAICKGCDQLKPIKWRGLCAKCYARFKRHGHTNRTRPIKGTKLCTVCGKKPIHAKKMCNRCYNKSLREKNPTRDFAYDLNKNWGISIDEYNALLKNQGYKCAICGADSNDTVNGKKTRLAVDHDHKTGEIRGLLCGNCNRGIGNLQDSINFLQKAIDYLKNHQQDS